MSWIINVVCGKFPETVSHVGTGCQVLVQREYKKRYHRMGLRVYWELCKKHGMQHCQRWYEETPEDVRVSKCRKFEIWWVKPINTWRKLEHNRSDIVLLVKARNI